MTQSVEASKFSPLATVLLLAVILAVSVAAGCAAWWFWSGAQPLNGGQLREMALKAISLWALCFVIAILIWHTFLSGVRKLVGASRTTPPPVLKANAQTSLSKMIGELRFHHGPLWRRKTRLYLVIGEPEQIQAIAPHLSQDHWLHGEHNVLLWGGSVQKPLTPSVTELCQQLTRWRALDGVIWALTPAQSKEQQILSHGVARLGELATKLGWSLPLHVWQVCDSQWPQPMRPTQAVGCALAEKTTAQAIDDALQTLIQPLRQEGWAEVSMDFKHDFLLRLSRDLQVEGIARWRQALAPLFGLYASSLPLRGLWFSLPLPAGEKSNNHHWPHEPAWAGVLNGHKQRIKRLGWPATRVAYRLAMGLALVWGVGMLLSFTSNRTQIAHLQNSLATLQTAEQGDPQLRAFSELTRELDRLDYRATHGTPWYQRFGLNQNDALLEALWPRYVEANQRLLRDPAAANLQAALNRLIKLPADSPLRSKLSAQAYDQLKAYLMLTRPDKVDSAFLAKTLMAAETERDGISTGLWQALTPELWKFYAEQLPAHPEWRLEADPTLVAQARQVLLSQLGQRNAEASLYEKVLADAANQAPALRLAQMVGDTDASALFSSRGEVPGVFTRQAWEGQVRQAINAIAEQRREEIDWVLSDSHHEIAADLTPEQLRQRLTERYFQDYANAWLNFLNGLRWREVKSLGEVIDQLALMSDARQSPLIALMNTLAYQGQAGARGPALSESLVKSAQKLMAQDAVAAIDQQLSGATSPLDKTFGPLLALIGKESENPERLSLAAFLNRVTRVRLKLQQVSNATNPQEMTQALAQSVFQGQNVDLTDTQSYGSLLAASLGAEWDGIGQTLFVQPLEQAWQRVLQPSAAGLNSQWQRSIVNEWHSAFAGRYPFAATTSDASLPMLGQMIRADSGRLEQFLQQQLGGVLRKEGQRWVADTRHSQGLRFNPQFLTAINQLSQLADVLFTDGGLGLSFELRGKGVRDIVDTTFILNGEKHHYFNQRERWQRFTWPGTSNHPGSRLLWTSVYTGERLFADYEGTWGLIRLLEHARITPLNDSDSQMRVQIKAPDNLELTWNLRTELGTGPLELLKLRGFELPTEVFLQEGDKARPVTKKRKSG